MYIDNFVVMNTDTEEIMETLNTKALAMKYAQQEMEDDPEVSLIVLEVIARTKRLLEVTKEEEELVHGSGQKDAPTEKKEGSLHKFIDAILAGEKIEASLDAYIEAWHNSKDSEEDIASYLGLKEEEYKLLAEDPSFLDYIIYIRKNNLAFGEFLWWDKLNKKHFVHPLISK